MKFIPYALAASLGIAACSLAVSAAEITGAGATFPFPIYSRWAESYNQETQNRLNYQSIGSSGGIRQIRAKTVDFGASDMPLTDEALANRAFADLDALEQAQAARCLTRREQPDVVRALTRFHWWPEAA